MKVVSMFLKFVSSVPRHFVYSPNFDVLVFRKALKAQISCSKIDFGSKFRQKQLKGQFYDFCLVSFVQILFLVLFWFWLKISKN